MQTHTMALENCGLSPVDLAGGKKLGRQATSERHVELENLLSKNLPRFRRLAMRWLRNPEDAEDAVQDAVLSAVKNIARFEGRAQMSTWLMAIVINAVRMQLRRRPRQQIFSLDQRSQEDQLAISDLIADPRPTPEQIMEQSELRALLSDLADGLPSAQRTAMQLRHWDDLSTSEAAEALGVPEGTLKARLARGRAKLTQQLRKRLGMSRTQSSQRGCGARRKACVGSGRRREIAPDGPFLPVFALEGQGGSATRISA